MIRRSGHRKSAHDDRLRDALDRMEPDFRLMKGTIAIMHALSETSDAVEPIALEAIAYLAGETLERLNTAWQEARYASQ